MAVVVLLFEILCDVMTRAMTGRMDAREHVREHVTYVTHFGVTCKRSNSGGVFRKNDGNFELGRRFVCTTLLYMI